MENQYNIKENGFDEIRNKTLLRSVPIALIAVFAGIAISHFNSNTQSSDINTLPFVIPIAIAALSFGLFRGLKRQKDIFNSFSLTIYEDSIVRKQNLTTDISIPIEQITAITKAENGTLVISGTSSGDVITIPKQIDRLDELESKLSSLKEITFGTTKSLIQKYQWVLTIGTVALMAIVYISNNKLLVGISGTLLTASLIYSLVVTQKSKHIDNKTKKSMWLVLIVIISVILITIFKVSGIE